MVLLLYYFGSNIKDVISVVLISFVLAYIFIPFRNYLVNKFKLSIKLSALIIVGGIITTMCIALIIMIPSLFDEISNIGNIIDKMSGYATSIYKKLRLERIPVFNELYNRAVEKINYMITGFSEEAIEKLIIYSDALLSFAVIPVIMYYFLCDGEMMYNTLMLMIPASKRIIIKKIIKDIDRVLSRYIAGQFFLCVIISFCSFVIFLLFRMKFIVWLSIVNGIFNIIPYFGPIFGGIPAILIAFMDSPKKGIYVTLSLFVLQQIEGNMLSPKITGKSIDMHPFVIILLLLVGESIGGFAGMIFIIPCAVILKVLYNDINYYIY